MTREKILEIARELGFIPRHVELDEYWMQLVEAFYHAAQAEALEAAAKLCDELAANGVFYKDYAEHAFAGDCAAAIREMAKEKQNATD